MKTSFLLHNSFSQITSTYERRVLLSFYRRQKVFLTSALLMYAFSFLLSEQNAFAQKEETPALPRKLNAHVEPKEVSFGRIFHVIIDFERPQGAVYTLPAILPSTSSVRPVADSEFKIVHQISALAEITPPSLNSSPKEPVKKNNSSAKSATQLAQKNNSPPPKWMLEHYEIPFLALDLTEVKTPSLLLKNKFAQTLDIPSLTLKVIDDDKNTNSTQKQKPPKNSPTNSNAAPQAPAAQAPSFSLSAGPQSFLVEDKRPWLIASIAFLILLGLFLKRKLSQLHLFHTRKKNETTDKIVPPTISAYNRALARLDALLAEGLLKKGETEIFTTRLMDEVLRDYLTARFAIEAEQRTTRELAQDLLDVGHEKLDIPLIKSLLEDADMIKFAKATLQVEVASKMAGKVRSLIENTRLQEKN